MNGTVKWFNNKKGYGFINGEDGKEYFFHYTAIISDKKFKALKDGVNVTYDTTTNEVGKTFAVNVQKRITPVINNNNANNVKEVSEDED